jgi:hypothetical protein
MKSQLFIHLIAASLASGSVLARTRATLDSTMAASRELVVDKAKAAEGIDAPGTAAARETF